MFPQGQGPHSHEPVRLPFEFALKRAELALEFGLKRMKEKAFAASVSRENIMECEAIGIPLSEFVEFCLGAMTAIRERLGL